MEKLLKFFIAILGIILIIGFILRLSKNSVIESVGFWIYVCATFFLAICVVIMTFLNKKK